MRVHSSKDDSETLLDPYLSIIIHLSIYHQSIISHLSIYLSSINLPIICLSINQLSIYLSTIYLYHHLHWEYGGKLDRKIDSSLKHQVNWPSVHSFNKHLSGSRCCAGHWEIQMWKACSWLWVTSSVVSKLASPPKLPKGQANLFLNRPQMMLLSYLCLIEG